MKFLSLFKERIFHIKTADLYDKIIKWMLVALIFLVPLFFLTPNSHPLELNKALLFNIIVLAATVLFFLQALIKREFIFFKTYLDWFILAFISFYLIAFIFSKNYYVSLVGISGYYSASILSTLCFILFFYLLIRYIKTGREVIWLLYSFLGSALLVIFYNLFHVLGVSLLPWAVTKQAGFNLIASSSATLAIFTAISLLISFGLFLVFKEKWQKIMCSVIGLLSLALLFLVHHIIVYYLLAICLFIYLLFIAAKSKQLPTWWAIWPTAVLTVMVLFVFINPSGFVEINISESVILDHKTSATVAWESLLDRPFWGSGPQTFTYDFSEYRPVEFNNTGLWNLRFIKGSNQWFGWLATIGLGGALAILGLGVWHIYKSAVALLTTKKADKDWTFQLSLLVSWLLIAFTTFVLPFNFILHFLCWFLLALGYKAFVLDKIPKISWSLKKSFTASIIMPVAFAAVTVVAVLVILFGVRIWLADYHYAKAMQEIEEVENLDAILSRLQKAIDLNPFEVKYYLSLAQGYATKSLLLANSPDTIVEQIQPLTQQVIDNINRAQEADPKNPAVYEQSVALYDSLRGLIANVDELSVKAYEQAVTLEPMNPLTHLNLGRARLLQAQEIASAGEIDQAAAQVTDLTNQAIEDFLMARQLKQNFVTVDYNLGLAYQSLGKFDEAIAMFEDIISDYPEAVEARWQLALIYEVQDKNNQAIAELEFILQIEPDNAVAKDKLENLTKPEEAGETDS